jgi:mannose-1-phosphate guanylyltransferase
MGTAGAVKNAERLLGETFIVFNGDVFTDIDLAAMMDLHCQKKASVSIALTPVEDPTIYGVVETDAENRVKRFIEKPSRDEVTTNMINAGIYILEPSVLSCITPNIFSTFEWDVFPLLLERGEAIYGYPSEAYWIDIGTPEKYLRLNHDLLQRYPHPARSIDGEGLGEGVKFEGESTVHPLARIEGPAIIGEGCFIGENSVIRGPVALGSRCQIEEGAMVEGAVLWQNCKVGKRAKLKNCVIASNCCIGEGSEVLDGCVLGDNVRIGEGNKLSQGIRIWPDKSIEPDAISF